MVTAMYTKQAHGTMYKVTDFQRMMWTEARVVVFQASPTGASIYLSPCISLSIPSALGKFSSTPPSKNQSAPPSASCSSSVGSRLNTATFPPRAFTWDANPAAG